MNFSKFSLSFLHQIGTIAQTGEELALERFHRIVALFESIAPRTDLDQELVVRFQAAVTRVRTKLANPPAAGEAPQPIGDDVHEVNLIFLSLAPIPLLLSLQHTIRADFQEAVGTDAFQRYLVSPGYLATAVAAGGTITAEQARALRADSIYAVNETIRQTRNLNHLEQVRSDHIAALNHGWSSIVPALVALAGLILLVSTAAQHYAPPYQPPSSWIADWGRTASAWLLEHQTNLPLQKVLYGIGVLALAGAAGACGAYLSVLLRILDVSGTGRMTRNLFQFQNSRTITHVSPIVGVIYGVLISWVFASGFISGVLFPKVDDNHVWYYVVFEEIEFAKWLVWAFIAGFSERLMPDMLDKLISQSQTAVANIGSTAPLTTPAAGGAATGQTTASSTTRPGSTPPPTPPPGSLTLVRTPLGVLRASWGAITGAVSYRVAYGTDPAALTELETTATSLPLIRLPATGTLIVKVVGLDARAQVLPGPEARQILP